MLMIFLDEGPPRMRGLLDVYAQSVLRSQRLR